MKYFFKIFIIILISNYNLVAKEEIKLKVPITDSDVSSWIQYLDSNNSDSDYKLLMKIAGHCERQNQSALSFYIIAKYESNFSRRKKKLLRLKLIYEEFMLAQMAQPTSYFVYDSYIKVNAPKDKALTALQMRVALDNNTLKWSQSVEVYKALKPYFKEKAYKVDELIELVSREWNNSIIRNLGDKINTIKAEWDPNPTPDGRYLYFSSRDRAGGFGNVDVWFSEKINNKWTEAKNIGPKVNSNKAETIDNVTTDGNGLILSGDFTGTFGHFDIYFLERADSTWGDLKHLPMPINSEYVDEGGSLSSDGKVLIFTSDRPGGVGRHIPYGINKHNGSTMGNMDLYCIFRKEGEWQENIINLGNLINTPYAERSPYLHPDGKTLYFSSNGHPGLGGLDVFKTTRLDSTWKNWSKPINLGKEVNTIQNDWGYKISVDGDSAFFAAENRTIGYGDWDLFTIKLPDEAKPEQVVTIVGKVQNSAGQPLGVDIKWEDLETGKIVGNLKSHPINGNYFIVLPLGKFYGYFAEKNKYYPSAKNIDLRGINKGSSFTVNITMFSEEEILKSERQVIINNIFFDTGKWGLKSESQPEIKRLVAFLKKNLDINIEISGHSDNIGDQNYNIELSQRRADAVKNELIKYGIEIERINSFGYGESQPINDNSTKEMRAANRRVEFKVLN